MALATIFCPNLACSARGQSGQGHVHIHSRQAQRFLCTTCGKTFTITKGTALYRLRTSSEMVSLVVTLRAHGGPLQAIVVAFGFDERPVASWGARAGIHGQAVPAHLVEQPCDLGQVQADAIRVKSQGSLVWMALALMVRTRLWRAGEVSTHRDMALSRRLMGRVRRCAAHPPLWLCTDGLSAYVRAIFETFRDPVRLGKHGRPRLRPWRNVGGAQVVTHHEQRRVVQVERRIVAGTPARVEMRRRRAQGDGVMNTAYIERLNATFRARLASLTRRGRALARCTLTLPHGMYRIGTVYHFCTPHASLRRPAPGAGMRGVPRTSAMAAGITEPCWSIRERLSSHVPPPRWTPPTPRGRPSRTLKHLIERWCS
jgi:transposase-like protein/IS1 family transposase